MPPSDWAESPTSTATLARMRHWNTLSTRLRLRLGLDREWWLLAVAAGVGALMGVAAIAFIMPIRWLERLPERMEAAEPWMRQAAVLAAPVVLVASRVPVV